MLTITSETLLWAATIFTSRAFISTHILPGRDTIPILFPVIDILNHSVSARVEWDFQPHHSFALKCLDGEHFTPKQELFNNYAPKQNDELLLGYGFCLEDNPIEQFALKLAFPPALQQHATSMGLLEAANIPFGMSTDFLEKDPNTEQHFLRVRGHPFGRYENNVPFLRGIPPYIVQFFFIQTVMTLDLDLSATDLARPGARITLHVLTLLHQAIEQRSLTLPLESSQEPKNDKQSYATLYRNGQARVIHSIRRELEAAIRSLRIPQGTPPQMATALLSIPDALATLADFPNESNKFRTGLTTHDLHSPSDEGTIWTLLLMSLITISLSASSSTDHLLFSIARDLFTRHPLPSLEDGIEDAETYTFIDEHLGDFLPSTNPGGSPMEVLDDIGLEYHKRPRGQVDVAARGSPVENLGARLVMWAMRVVEQDVVAVREGGKMKRCLYVRSLGMDGTWSDEEWVYRDVDAGEDAV